MNRILSIMSVAGCNFVAAGLVFGGRRPETDLTMLMASIFFMMGAVGAIWMLYTVIRWESQPLLYAILALVPYTFVWYYFERVSGSRLSARSTGTNDQPRLRIGVFVLVVIAWLVGLWLELGIREPRYLPALALMMLPLAINSVGQLWMLYAVIRYEVRPLPYIFLAFIPFVFVWYYFTRARAGGARKQGSVPAGPPGSRVASHHTVVDSRWGWRVWLSRLTLIVLIVCTSGFALWYVLGSWKPQGAFAKALLVIFFGIHPFGALWMLYKSLLCERQRVRYAILSLAPYAFLWYYFARILPRKAPRLQLFESG
jgi:hypothetical protein